MFCGRKVIVGMHAVEETSPMKRGLKSSTRKLGRTMAFTLKRLPR